MCEITTTLKTFAHATPMEWDPLLISSRVRQKGQSSSCTIAVCGAKYKTRPGLSYHYNHTHREKSGGGVAGTSSEVGPGAQANQQPGVFPPAPPPPEAEHEIEGPSAPSSVGGSSLTPPSTPGGASSQDAADSGVIKTQKTHHIEITHEYHFPLSFASHSMHT